MEILSVNMKKIFILAPANAETGGVESLHQLYGAIQRRGLDPGIGYVRNIQINSQPQWNPKPFLGSNAIPERYQQYGPFRQVDDIPDAEDVVVIVPEIFQSAAIGLQKALPCMWALAAFPLCGDGWNGRRVLPIASCHYAITVFAQGVRGAIRPLLVTDYLSPEMVVKESDLNIDNRKNGVAYFGGRGCVESEAILESLRKTLTFPSKRLFGMTSAELAAACREYRYYIYPARQPGADRGPKEAAVNGCVIFVLRQGAADVRADVPLPERFVCNTLAELESRLASSLGNVQQYYTDFNDQREYREFIRGDKDRFEACVTNLLREL
jgi:hypothetical protein